MPWMKLFTEDLDRDCSALSLRAFGAWMRIIIDLKSHDGTRSLSLDGWASVVRSNREETVAALSELIDDQLCDSNVTRDVLSQKNDALITVTCRRIVREANIMHSHKLRQKRYRERLKSNASRNASITGIGAEAEADIEAEAGVCVVSSSGRRVGKPVQKVSAKKTHTHTAAADFILTEELQKFVETGYPELDPEAQAEKFRNYFGRNSKTFPDIDKAFRSWIQEAEERRQHRAREPSRPVRESVAEHNARVFAELNAMSEDEIRIMQGLEPRGGKPP
jgi:hypothetical protein